MLCLVVAAATTAALAFTAVSAAHQTVTISGSELVIEGDKTKPTDEVTITYDSVKEEFVIGHDIEDPIPPGCYRDAVEPFHKLHCPAKGITKIRVEVGSANDTVRQENIIDIVSTAGVPTGALIVPKDLVSIEVNTGSGNDRFEEEPTDVFEKNMQEDNEIEEERAKEAQAVMKLSMGVGADTVTLSRGVSTVDFDGSARLNVLGGINQVDVALGGSSLNLLDGFNTIAVGAGNSKATVSGGDNSVTLGAGASSFTASGGDNTVAFGAGNSIFSGGTGSDSVLFGPGNNTFSGGGGADSVSLGPGRDTAGGGPGKDTLRGGPGKDTLRGGSGADRLFGGPAFDSIFGGPGPDQCFPGGPGFEASCP